jgi:hypothetical protein
MTHMSFLLISSIWVVSACITGRESEIPRRHEWETEKKAEKSQGQLPGESKSRQDQVSLANFILRLSSPDAKLTDSDLNLTKKLKPNYPRGTYGEAAFVVSLVHGVLAQDVAIAEDFESLETASLKHEIDFSSALKHNPALQTFGFYALVAKTMAVGTNSVPFKKTIQEIIDGKQEQWAGLKVYQIPAEAPIEEDLGLLDSGKNYTAASNTTAHPAIAFESSHLVDDDSILLQANDLAGKSHYSPAIDLLAGLPSDSPLYEAAQEKIIEFSNQAVLSLRQRAATAYQNSFPISDPKAKTAYLQEAKNHLEEALNKFPQANQIGVVKENLSVINRDLQRMSNMDAPSRQ